MKTCELCDNIALYRYPGRCSSRCELHKTSQMIKLVKLICHCYKVAKFGSPDNGIAIRCETHKIETDVMLVNIKSSKFKKDIPKRTYSKKTCYCGDIANFGPPFSRKRLTCAIHALPDFVNLDIKISRIKKPKQLKTQDTKKLKLSVVDLDKLIPEDDLSYSDSSTIVDNPADNSSNTPDNSSEMIKPSKEDTISKSVSDDWIDIDLDDLYNPLIEHIRESYNSFKSSTKKSDDLCNNDFKTMYMVSPNIDKINKQFSIYVNPSKVFQINNIPNYF